MAGPRQWAGHAPSQPVAESSDPIRRQSPLLRRCSDFLRTEAAGGALLVAGRGGGAGVGELAVVRRVRLASGTAASASLEIAGHTLDLDLRHWVNDGAMAIFFLVVGLEIKREVTSGHLAGRRAAALPVAAAIGGMVVPAGIYLAIAGGTEAKGWGVPMATDIALAVGVMALAGEGVPASLRAFLLGLAVVDDIGAILVIAVFYSSGVAFAWLAVGWAGRRRRRGRAPARRAPRLPSSVLGALTWFCLHEAGVHPPWPAW